MFACIAHLFNEDSTPFANLYVLTHQYFYETTRSWRLVKSMEGKLDRIWTSFFYNFFHHYYNLLFLFNYLLFSMDPEGLGRGHTAPMINYGSYVNLNPNKGSGKRGIEPQVIEF